jgi:uncharacterized protein (TIGR01777 family)
MAGLGRRLATMTEKAVIPGGSGFLGRALARTLADAGWEVVILSRRPEPADGSIRTVLWDGRTRGKWAEELEGARALVNFTGRSVACVHDAANRREIMASRVDSVRAIDAALAGCRRPPPLWLQATSLAIYGDAGDRICAESAPEAGGFSADVCRAWEQTLFGGTGGAGTTRRAALRIGIVLGPGGGGLEPLARLARWGLGGAAGNGRQYISWIQIDDFCAVCRWLIERPESAGVYNATGPNPVTNAEFMRALRHALGRPWSPPAPAWAVRLGARFVMKVDADLALTGRRAVPQRLLAEAFPFRHPDLTTTLRAILGPQTQKKV